MISSEKRTKWEGGKEMFDYCKLRGKIKEKFSTQDNFAKALGIGRTALSQRLNNVLEFSQSEMFNACDLLGIPHSKISEYFFCLESSENRTKAV